MREKIIIGILLLVIVAIGFLYYRAILNEELARTRQEKEQAIELYKDALKQTVKDQARLESLEEANKRAAEERQKEREASQRRENLLASKIDRLERRVEENKPEPPVNFPQPGELSPEDKEKLDSLEKYAYDLQQKVVDLNEINSTQKDQLFEKDRKYELLQQDYSDLLAEHAQMRTAKESVERALARLQQKDKVTEREVSLLAKKLGIDWFPKIGLGAGFGYNPNTGRMEPILPAIQITIWEF